MALARSESLVPSSVLMENAQWRSWVACTRRGRRASAVRAARLGWEDERWDKGCVGHVAAADGVLGHENRGPPPPHGSHGMAACSSEAFPIRAHTAGRGAHRIRPEPEDGLGRYRRAGQFEQNAIQVLGEGCGGGEGEGGCARGRGARGRRASGSKCALGRGIGLRSHPRKMIESISIAPVTTTTQGCSDTGCYNHRPAPGRDGWDAASRKDARGRVRAGGACAESFGGACSIRAVGHWYCLVTSDR